MSTETLNMVIIFGYIVILLATGFWAWQKSNKSKSQFLMANRQFGTLVVFAGIFAGNMSAFAMIGGPGFSYHNGFSSPVYLASLGAVAIPISLYFANFRLWQLGKHFNYVTPEEAISDRLDSKAVKWVLFALFMIFLIPYGEVGVIGGGRILDILTGGMIPYWAGCIIPVIAVLIYLAIGGMKSAGWVNVVHCFVFLTVLLIAFFVIPANIGGFREATEAALAVNPDLASTAGNAAFSPAKWLLFSLVVTGVSVGVFPHLMMRFATSASIKTIKTMFIAYPAALAITWIAGSYIGVWGAGQFPGLIGAESDNILPMMAAQFAPAIVGGLLSAGMLAAMMSTLDAQLLTVSIMASRNFSFREKNREAIDDQAADRKEMLWSRAWIGIMCVVAVALAISKPVAIVKLAELSLSGFACMLPSIIAVQWWKRTTKQGVLASLLVSSAMLPFLFFLDAPSWMTFGTGLPAVPAMTVSVILLLAVSLMTPPHSREKIDKWWSVFKPGKVTS